MVAPGVFGDMPQMSGPRQSLKHVDRCDDVVIDRFTLSFGQRARSNRQIFQLVGTEKRRLRASHVPPAVMAGDASDPGNIFIVHLLDAMIDLPDKSSVSVALSAKILINLLRLRQALSLGDGSPLTHLGIAFQYLKAGIDQIDPVKNSLQLAGFIDDMDRRRYLAAIMKQRGDS